MTRITRFLVAGLAFAYATGLGAAPNTPAQSLNRFSASIYGQLAKNGGGNLVVSPFSISTALSMVMAGARGETAAELAKVLGQDSPDPQYHAQLAALADQIVKAANSGGSQLLYSNGLWVQQGFKILPDFRGTLENVYHAAPSTADFEREMERSRADINAWVERQTRGKIRDLFAPGSLDRRTRLVLASAAYFYGKWERPFRPTDTRPAPFTPASGTPVQTDFMNQTGRFGYAETAAGQVLEMRYAGTGLAFDILLPKKGAAPESMDPANPEKLAGWLGSLENRTVQASIPKFRVESDFPLVEVLKQIGLQSPFGNSADFSGIDDRRDLRLSQVVHKAYIDVNEEGTEAAAATGTGMMAVAMRVEQNPVFRADHPFVFLIRDTRSGLILFSGRLSDPKR
jgi:serpin B